MSDIIDYLGENYYTGWDDKPDLTAEIVASLPEPTIGDTAIGDMPISDLPKEVALWKFFSKVAGSPVWKIENQGSVGSCVSFGTCRAIEASNVVEIANGEPETFKYLCRPIVYGGSRVEANGGRAAFRSDGSTGSLAAKWSTLWGNLPQEKIAGFDLSIYTPSLCREWGATGVPNALETYCKEHPTRACTLVTNVEEAQKALANGYGINVCSSQGFNTKRSADGICAPSGTWNHSMCITGYTHIKDVLYFFIENSWGAYMGDKNPAPLGANIATFLAKGDVVNSMLARRDSFAYAGFKGFIRNDLDWSF